MAYIETLIFEKEYSAEAFCDIEQDVMESLDPAYNEAMELIPTDEDGFLNGTFKITITWEPYNY